MDVSHSLHLYFSFELCHFHLLKHFMNQQERKKRKKEPLMYYINLLKH